MSAQRQHETFYSMDEYLDFEKNSNHRHEFFQGGIYAMAGTTPRHNEITLNITTSLVLQLRGRPCKARGMDQRLRVDDADLTTYPDVLVVCPPERMGPTDSIAITDATVIVEVLSPSTARYDQTAKFDFYCCLDSLRHYLPVEAESIGVEHRFLQDGEWQTERFNNLNDEIELRAVNCRLKLREIYEEIEF